MVNLLNTTRSAGPAILPAPALLPRIRCTGKFDIAMADIVLTTLNAKYIHAAFGLRYLLANLGPLRASAAIVEFDINRRPVEIAEALLARNPRIIGLGIYIFWAGPRSATNSTRSPSCNWPTTSSPAKPM